MVAPNSSGIYLYAIIPAGDKIVFDVAGAGNDNDEVYTIPYRNLAASSAQPLAALVSASPLPDYRGLKRNQAVVYLVAHQRVVETVMRDFPLLPVKFGTVLADEAQVQHLLAQGETLFRSALEKFSSQMQMEVVVLWNLQQVFQEIGQEAEVVDLKMKIAGRPPEETTSERVAIGQKVQAFLAQRRAALQYRLIPALRMVTPDLIVNPPMDDSMVTNVALLLDQASQAALDRQLEQLDQEFGGKLLFRRVGPLPPYSFATVDVQLPSFETIDLARHCLGLEEMVDPGEIKRAYHRLAGQLHPDLNPGDLQAETHMVELTQAYKLLTNYAENLQRGGRTVEDKAISPCNFNREIVEGTLLIAIRQQEILVGG